jgi:glycosyltransferase involved in cell wall biosynthesis
MSSVDDHYPPQLLDDYLSQALDDNALRATSVRTDSLRARHLLVQESVGPGVSLDDLLRAARGEIEVPRGFNPSRVNLNGFKDLVRVLAMQQILPDDVADSFALCELLLSLIDPARVPRPQQGFHAQLAYALGKFDHAHALLDRYPKVDEIIRLTLQLDLANPFIRAGDPDQTSWLRRFDSLLGAGLELTDTEDAAPFNRLDAAPPPAVQHETRISVIVTCFEPTADLPAAVRSLSRQSWSNIEILVVDDGSRTDPGPVLEQCLALDERVRVIRLPVNVGTYGARNRAFDEATGDFITFLDSDDWAHPRRLEKQVQPLLSEDSLVATTCQALRVTEMLELTEPGRSPFTLGPASLMFRKDAALARLGYIDPIRGSADNEYLRRMVAVFGDNSLLRLRERLVVYRQRRGSLSRADFRGSLWIHPARYAYRSAYTLYHEDIRAGRTEPYLPKNPVHRQFPAPSHLVRADRAPASAEYDVVFAGDWRRFHGVQREMVEEMQMLSRQGLRVGVLQMATFRWMTSERLWVCLPVQRLINRGSVSYCLSTDQTSSALVLIRDPSILQFPRHQPPGVTAKLTAIVASEAPSALDGSDSRYVPQACTAAARELFGAPTVWIPQDQKVRHALEMSGLSQPELASFELPGVIDPREWRVERTGFRADVPVVGRHSRDSSTAWPRERETLFQVYPDSSDTDIRVLGGARSALEILGDAALPSNWLVYDYDEIDVRSFLYQLDFWVYFSDPAEGEALNREVLEALASGCVVILPHRFEETFGDAALYRHPTEVKETVQTYHRQRALFLAQSRRGRARVIELFDPSTYLKQTSTLLERSSPATGPQNEPAGVLPAGTGSQTSSEDGIEERSRSRT